MAATDAGKVVAAICVAPAVLARAGILRQKAATCYPDAALIGVLKGYEARYRDEEVVRTRRLVTANGPAAAERFAQLVVELARDRNVE